MLRREVRLVVILATVVLLGVLVFFEWSVESGQPDRGMRQSSFHTSRVMDINHRPPGMGHSKSSPRGKKHKSWYTFDPLPHNVVNAVDRFVFFVGYARSGHSIIASMLDAHPNVVIAHEYAIFSRWSNHPDMYTNKTILLNTLYNSSRYSVQAGLRRAQAGIKRKGYSLAIPGWYQGTYEGTINVIGDKAGGMTAQVYRNSRKDFQTVYKQLQATVLVPLHAIHVVRNPYDNIATMLLYNEHVKQSVNLTHKYRNEEALGMQIKAYFSQVQSVLEMIEKVRLNDITIHHGEFVANPKGIMRRLCLELFIPCSERYLHMVAENTFTSESRSRHLVEWTPDLLSVVEQNIAKYPLLKRYTFK